MSTIPVIIGATCSLLSLQLQALEMPDMSSVSDTVSNKVSDVFGEGYQTFSGDASFDLYYYNQEDSKGSPPSIVPTLSMQPKFYKEFFDGDLGFNFVPFLRLTEHGNTSADYDIRELNFKYFLDDWTFKAGFDREFWGVTESTNKVDVLNQVDLAGTLGGIQKLGQPMFKVSYASDYGEFSGYWLPYFRTRTFPGPNSALGDLPGVQQDEDAVGFEGKNRRWHQDFAFRWTHTFGDIDMALSFFNGVDRTPIVLPTRDKNNVIVTNIFRGLDNEIIYNSAAIGTSPSDPSVQEITLNAGQENSRLATDIEQSDILDNLGSGAYFGLPAEITPFYVIKRQLGLEAQYTKGSWIFKTEITAVNSFKEDEGFVGGDGSYAEVQRDYQTFTGGIEYVIPGLFGTPADLTIFSEYLWDSRETSPFESDIFLASRLNFNDEQGSDAFISIIKDTDTAQALYSIGASRRLGDSWRIGLSGITFRGISKAEAEQALGIRQIDFVQFQIKRFF